MYLFYEKINDTKAKVTLIYYADPLPEDLKLEDYIHIEDLPDEDSGKDGKLAVLYCNPGDNSVWYEYENRQQTTEERLSNMEIAIASLMGA